jgi:hypothetical protein
MTARTVRTWECDRCHVTDETKPTTQPPTWIGVITVEPPEASPEIDNSRRWHLCRHCKSNLTTFLSGDSTESISVVEAAS